MTPQSAPAQSWFVQHASHALIRRGYAFRLQLALVVGRVSIARQAQTLAAGVLHR
ncbi:hypothetical protein [Kitasatospora paranensis]|uniref:Uncharacterized protein n=1 Tax=Kitasatospora paranensis TaxID=258053 RepID=A0ABW2G3E1_9ACTN